MGRVVMQRGVNHEWAIVLAGGEGVRLRPLIRRLYGEDRPKQYAALTGPRSLLRQTLDRVGLQIAPTRTVVVTLESHARYTRRALGAPPGPHWLAQPDDRGTAAAILLAAHWIAARDPRAVVAVFPSDHFIRDDRLFMDQVADVAAGVHAFPDQLILLGAPPTGPESDYGWIELGPPIGSTSCGPLSRGRRFWEKPSPALARVLFSVGALWSTFVFAASVGTLIDAGRRFLPRWHEGLTAVAAGAGSAEGSGALREAYRWAPSADFSRAILMASEQATVVAALPPRMWCDLGTEARVMSVLDPVGPTLPEPAASAL